MGNLLDYIRWRGDIPFSVIPPGEADELIFSHIAYLDLSEIISDRPIRLADAYAAWKKKGYRAPEGIHSIFLWDEIVPMFGLLAGTVRYADCIFSDFECSCDEAKGSQFGAVTLTLPGIESKHLLFRGTDDTLVGWKENFCMSYLSAIPAQVSAVDYLCRHSGNSDLILNGHSKGGNLAVFAAATAPPDIRERIGAVWNFDGPGFRREFLQTEGYRRIAGRIRRYVPESSVFGMMLANDGHYRVVKSRAQGVAQHDGFSWEISGQGFCYAEALSEKSRLLHRIMTKWLSDIPDCRREELVNCVFHMLADEKFRSMTEVKAKGNRRRVIHAYLRADPASRRLVFVHFFPLYRLWRSAEIIQERRQKQALNTRLTPNHNKPAET